MKYIYHNLGLGDHIMCNGLVRYIKEIEGIVSIFCKPNYYNNVKYMFRDDENIKILPIGGDILTQNYILDNKIQNNLIITNLCYSLENIDSYNTIFKRINYFDHIKNFECQTFDKVYYKMLKIPFNVRFDNFFLKRNYSLEKIICKNLNPNNEKYLFVHNVDKNKIRNDLKIIENPIEYNVFDLLSLIENAEEVHLMESSIKNLVNSIKMDKPKFFYHKYVRKEYNHSFFNTEGLNKFEIII
jgi:hypothetical protein